MYINFSNLPYTDEETKNPLKLNVHDIHLNHLKYMLLSGHPKGSKIDR